MTDFIRKKEADTYTGRIKDGIALHRQIDTFTDQHPASLELRALLRKRHGKYASVVVDLVWDHFLSLNWSHYSGSPLPSFNKGIYEILQSRKADLPDVLKRKIDKMIGSDFLMAYANEENMRRSLIWMDERVKYSSSFEEAILDIHEHKDRIDELFMGFFPELIAHAESFCSC